MKLKLLLLLLFTATITFGQKRNPYVTAPFTIAGYNGLSFQVVNHNYSNDGNYYWGIIAKNNYQQPVRFEYRLKVGGIYAGKGAGHWDVSTKIPPGGTHKNGAAIVSAMLFATSSTNFYFEIRNVKIGDEIDKSEDKKINAGKKTNGNKKDGEITEYGEKYGESVKFVKNYKNGKREGMSYLYTKRWDGNYYLREEEKWENGRIIEMKVYNDYPGNNNYLTGIYKYDWVNMKITGIRDYGGGDSKGDVSKFQNAEYRPIDVEYCIDVADDNDNEDEQYNSTNNPTNNNSTNKSTNNNTSNNSNSSSSNSTNNPAADNSGAASGSAIEGGSVNVKTNNELEQTNAKDDYRSLSDGDILKQYFHCSNYKLVASYPLRSDLNSETPGIPSMLQTPLIKFSSDGVASTTGNYGSGMDEEHYKSDVFRTVEKFNVYDLHNFSVHLNFIPYGNRGKEVFTKTDVNMPVIYMGNGKIGLDLNENSSLRVTTNSRTKVYNTEAVISHDKWNHLVLTYNKGRLRVFLNGKICFDKYVEIENYNYYWHGRIGSYCGSDGSAFIGKWQGLKIYNIGCN